MSVLEAKPGPCDPLGLLYEADRTDVGRMFALPKGRKFSPPKGVTGDVPVLEDPGRGVHAAAAVESLASGGNAGLRLSPGFVAVDMDTKKLADDVWGQVEAEVEGVLGGLRPHNTTSMIRFHGHYIFSGTVPADVSGKVRIGGVCVGDVIRPDHRYMATGAEYLTCRYPPSLLPRKVVDWIELKPAPRPPRRPDRSTVVGWVPSDKAPMLGVGERNDGMARTAGIMLSKGGVGVEALHAENQRRCRPPLPDAEIKAIWASVGRYH